MKPTLNSCAAAALLATSATAVAQTDCDQQIRQLEQTIEQRQIDQPLKTPLQLLRAAEENPGDCRPYLARAEEVMAQRSSDEVAHRDMCAVLHTPGVPRASR
jgi:hypothetical protein